MATVTLPTDSTAPAKPSTPVVEPRAGILNVAWDGLDSLAATMPADWAATEVHVSETSGFTPNAATLVGSFTAKAGLTIEGDR